MDKKLVKNYQNQREERVLELVRKYPMYSLNRLKEELPEVSRHSIQLILEKHNLSKAQDRLGFAQTNEEGTGFPKKTITLFSRFLGSSNLRFLKAFCLKVIRKPKLKQKGMVVLAVTIILLLVFLFLKSYFSAELPKITIDLPQENFKNEGEKIFVRGKVVPLNSLVKINNIKVSLNGDGTFTAIVNIPTGENVLNIEAVNSFNRRKKSQVLILGARVPTEEEVKLKEEKTVQKKRGATDRAVSLERKVNDILAAKNSANNSSGKKGNLRIINNRIKEEAGFYSVVGEVVNLGKIEVNWVMITVAFLDQAGAVIDTKYGFATDFNQVLKPGKSAEFETQPTTKVFDNYKLELSWEEPVVAGEKTEATQSSGIKKN